MLELKSLSMQRLSHQRGCMVFRIRTNRCKSRLKAGAVCGITHDWMADMREMHAYLMRTPGFENEPKQRNIAGRSLAWKDVENLVMGFCLATVVAPRDGDFEAIGTASL